MRLLNRIFARSFTEMTTTSLLPQKEPKVLINCMPNNIFITCSDTNPYKLHFWLSSGRVGAKNTAKTAPKTAIALIDAMKAKLSAMNVSTIRLEFRGITTARGVLVSQIRGAGLMVTEISDSTRIPFNGCRPKKSRRV